MISRRAAVLVMTFVVIFFTSLCLFIYMRTSPRFEIERIGVRGNSRLVPQAIVEYLDIQPHTNIFQVQLDEIQQRLEALQWVKTAEVFRNFPNKISIDLTERMPFALLKLDQLYLVDREGVILGALATGNEIPLPIITGAFLEDIAKNGENPKLRQALEAIDELLHSQNPLFHHIRKIQIHSLENTILMSYASYPEIRVSLVHYKQNMQRLQRVYAEIDSENLAYIDLRFDKRIIVMPKS